MLILSRKQGQSIFIGRHAGIKIRVLEIDPRGQVRIGIEAPDDIPVHREEIYHAIQEEISDKRRRHGD